MPTEKPFHIWLEFEFWEPQKDDDPENDFCNVQVTLADGRKYALNVWTFGFLQRAVKDCQDTGENLHGSYLLPPDLFVKRLDRALIEQVVTDLIGHHGLRDEWEVREPGDDLSRRNAPEHEQEQPSQME